MINFKNDAKKVLSDTTYKMLFKKYQKDNGALFSSHDKDKKELHKIYYSQKQKIQETIDIAYDLLINGPLCTLIFEEDLEDLVLVDVNENMDKEYIGIADFYIVNSKEEIIIKFKMFDLFARNQIKNCPTYQYFYTQEDVKSQSILENGFNESFFYKNKLRMRFDNNLILQQEEAILKLCNIIRNINRTLTFNIEFFDLDSNYHESANLVPVINMFVEGNSYPKTSLISDIYDNDPYKMLYDSLHRHMKERFGVNDNLELQIIIENAEKINQALEEYDIETIGFQISEKSRLHTGAFKCVIIKDSILDKEAELIIPFDNEVNIENLFNNKIHLVIDNRNAGSDFFVTLSEYIENPQEILEYLYLNGY